MGNRSLKSADTELEGSDLEVRVPANEELSLVQSFRRHILTGNVEGVGDLSEVDRDPRTIHVAAFDGSEVVGCVRLEYMASEVSAYFASRMATKACLQRTGVGTKVLVYAQALAAHKGAKSISLDARSSAVGFYEKMGYVKDSDRSAFKAGDIAMIKTV